MSPFLAAAATAARTLRLARPFAVVAFARPFPSPPFAAADLVVRSDQYVSIGSDQNAAYPGAESSGEGKRGQAGRRGRLGRRVSEPRTGRSARSGRPA